MGITTGGRYIGFQVFISRLSPPVLQPRRARFYAKLVNGVLPLAKGTLVFKFLFLNFRLQFCNLAGLGFTQNWLMGIIARGRYTGFQVFIPRLSPPVLYASLQCKLGSNSGRIAYFATKTGSGQQGALHIER